MFERGVDGGLIARRSDRTSAMRAALCVRPVAMSGRRPARTAGSSSDTRSVRLVGVGPGREQVGSITRRVAVG